MKLQDEYVPSSWAWFEGNAKLLQKSWELSWHPWEPQKLLALVFYKMEIWILATSNSFSCHGDEKWDNDGERTPWINGYENIHRYLFCIDEET